MNINTADFPTIITERLLLSELQISHAAQLFELLTNEAVIRYYPVMPFKVVEDTIPVIEKFVQNFNSGEEIRWGIFSRSTGQLMGNISLLHLVPKTKAVAVFALHPTYWKHGYASEALKSIIKYGWEQLQLQCIEADVMPGNHASERILTRCGFNYKAFQPNALKWNNEVYDINKYMLLP
jgi:ribosomal-protein-alanine N-acetyltransferase